MDEAERKIEEIVKEILEKLGFSVRTHYTFEKPFEVDVLALRNGLTILIEIIERDIVTLDSVAKLKTLASYLRAKYDNITTRQIVISTAKKVSVDVSTFAQENNIDMILTEPTLDGIKKNMNKIKVIEPISRHAIDVMEIISTELERSGKRSRSDLLNRIRKWYSKRGSAYVRNNIENEIREIIERHGVMV